MQFSYESVSSSDSSGLYRAPPGLCACMCAISPTVTHVPPSDWTIRGSLQSGNAHLPPDAAHSKFRSAPGGLRADTFSSDHGDTPYGPLDRVGATGMTARAPVG